MAPRRNLKARAKSLAAVARSVARLAIETVAPERHPRTAEAKMAKSIHDFTVKTIRGESKKLA